MELLRRYTVLEDRSVVEYKCNYISNETNAHDT